MSFKKTSRHGGSTQTTSDQNAGSTAVPGLAASCWLLVSGRRTSLLMPIFLLTPDSPRGCLGRNFAAAEIKVGVHDVRP